MKIFAGRIATETNTFLGTVTNLNDFLVLRSAGVLNGRAPDLSLDVVSEVWRRQAEVLGYTFVSGLNAYAQPGGITEQTSYESLRDDLLGDLSAAMPVDVVLLMLHGAMLAQGYDDCEEDIIRRVRNIAGHDAVIGVEFDLHCHLRAPKIACADIVVTYKEYPHVDAADRAAELFDLAIATRLGQVLPKMALFDCQMVGLYPTSRQPLRGFVDTMMDAERSTGGVLSISFGHGFQFADLPHVGAKVLVVTDDDQALAEQVAQQFGLRLYGLRQEIGFDSLSLPLEVALTKALASTKTPVVVADQSDNPGAGAPGDATFALRWLIDRRAEDIAMAIFFDPEVVKRAKAAGTGAQLSITLGGKSGPLSGDPVTMNVVVLSLLDSYMHRFPQQSGASRVFPLGDVVALRCGSIDIVVSSKRCQCFSPSIFVDLGIEPRSKRLLIPKSAQHFYGDFALVAREIIYMAAPGPVAPDPRMIPYRRLDTHRLYPWIEDPLGS